MTLTVGNNSQWLRFAPAVGHPEWLTDPRFVNVEARIRHREVLTPMVDELFLRKTVAQWLEILYAAEIPAGPIYEMPQVFADDQVQHRGMRREVPHSSGQPVALIANPIRYREQPLAPYRAPPHLGEHTATVLSDDLGLDPETVARLRAAGII